MRMNALRPFVAVAIVLLISACSKEKQAAPGGPPPNAKAVDESKAGSVSGRVTIDGPVPANPPIKMSADPYCMHENPNGATPTFVGQVADLSALDDFEFGYAVDGNDVLARFVTRPNDWTEDNLDIRLADYDAGLLAADVLFV